MKFVDNFLNGITMYKLVFYGLMILMLIAVVFGFIGLLPYGGFSLIISFLILVWVCYGTNLAIAKFLNVQTNLESAWITSLILFFVLFPIESWADFYTLVVAGVLAMASKYVLALHKKHIFNPVAISIFFIGLIGWGVPWWVGNSVLFIPVAILGFLILRKTHRFQMFLSFFLVSIATISIFNLSTHSNLWQDLSLVFLSGPILFLGTVMLTEPMTTPTEKRWQIIYGALVGLLFGLFYDFQFHIGIFSATPEFALIIGNIFSYIVSPRIRVILTLVRKDKLTADVYDFVWTSSEKLKFKAGQYLEWTLGGFTPDARGNRRYFTIASSPTEDNIHLGVKFYPKSSTFKTKLLSLEPGATIVASELMGDFTLPEDQKKKLVFIAGGIGITPFRSMAQYVLDIGEKRDVVLMFSNRTPEDIVYKNLFDSCASVSWKVVYAGLITKEQIVAEVPDYLERYYYISGPHVMVEAFKTNLKQLGVSKSKIKVDFFPGYA